MKICTNCKNEFPKSAVVGGNIGILWIVFFFVSMGIGFILWLMIGRKKKETCPYCKSEYVMEKEFYKGDLPNNKEEENNTDTSFEYAYKATKERESKEQKAKINKRIIIGVIVFIAFFVLRSIEK